MSVSDVSCSSVFVNLEREIDIWATAFIYDEDDNMWRQAGFVEMLVSPAKRGQNEMGGLQKRGSFKPF